MIRDVSAAIQITTIAGNPLEVIIPDATSSIYLARSLENPLYNLWTVSRCRFTPNYFDRRLGITANDRHLSTGRYRVHTHGVVCERGLARACDYIRVHVRILIPPRQLLARLSARPLASARGLCARRGSVTLPTCILTHIHVFCHAATHKLPD